MNTLRLRLPAVWFPRTRRAAAVARSFGLPPRFPQAAATLDPQALRELIPRPGQIALVGGESGAGKSTLLHRLLALDPPARWIDLAQLDLPDRPLVECFPAVRLGRAMKLLAAVGLAEAEACLRSPAQLSEGQRWRFRLALALYHAERRGASPGRPILLADEFAAVLDRLTALIVARTLRRSINPPLAAIVATAHDDLAPALLPDYRLRCTQQAGVILVSKEESK